MVAGGVRKSTKENKRTKAAVLMSTAWSIWKENQQIFDQHQLNEMQVEQEIKSEIMVQKVASGEPEIPLVS